MATTALSWRWGWWCVSLRGENNNQPWRDIASLLHEGTQGEPQAIKNPKVIRRVWGALRVFELIVLIQMPLIRAEAAHQEEHHAHANIGKDYTHPDLIGQRVQKGEHARLGLLRLLNHDGDAQAHEGLGKVNDLLSDQRDSERSHSDVGSLRKWERGAHGFRRITQNQQVPSSSWVQNEQSRDQVMSKKHRASTGKQFVRVLHKNKTALLLKRLHFQKVKTQKRIQQ